MLRERGLEQPLEVLRRHLASAPANELRVPVPVPAAVGLLAQHLHQAGRVDALRPVRRVRRDRLGRVVERGEAAEPRAHEVVDALDALGIGPVRDVDDDEPARHDAVAAALGDDRRHPPSDAPTSTGGLPSASATAIASAANAVNE